MSPLRTHSDPYKQRSGERASLHMNDQVQSYKSYVDADMLLWLKGLALDTCNMEPSSDLAQNLWHQSLYVRNILFKRNAECSQVCCN